MSQRRRAVGNTVSDLIGPRSEPQSSIPRDERVTSQPTGGYTVMLFNFKIIVFSVHVAPPTFQPNVAAAYAAQVVTSQSSVLHVSNLNAEVKVTNI